MMNDAKGGAGQMPGAAFFAGTRFIAYSSPQWENVA